MLLILSVCLAMVLSVRAEDGTISDLFLSEQDLETDYRSQHFAQVKQTLLAAWQGDLARDKAWDNLGRKLEKRLRDVKEQGSEGVPVVQFRDIENNGGRLPRNVAQKVSKKGIVIVRGVPVVQFRDIENNGGRLP